MGKKPRQEPIPVRRSGCIHCGNSHPSSECRKITGGCFRCGDRNHAIKDCPHPQIQPNRTFQPRPAGPQYQAPLQAPVRPPQQQQYQQQARPVQNPVARPPPNRTYQNRPNQQQIRPNQQGRFFNINRADAELAGDVIEGKILVCGVEARYYLTHDPHTPFYLLCLQIKLMHRIQI